MEIDFEKLEPIRLPQESGRYHIPNGYTAEIVDGFIVIRPTESEDERMAKAAIEFIDGSCVIKVDEISKQEVIAWLEKQKDSPMPEDTVIFQNGVAEGRRLEREDMEKGRLNVPVWRRSEEELFTDDYSDNFFIKQGHTNLYRANDVHKGELYLRVKDVEELLDNLPYPSNYKRKKKVGRIDKEQKPVWSEEDGKMLVAISKALGCDTAEKILVNEGVTLVSAAGFLESLKNRGNSLKSNTNSPSWKPSDEQMGLFGRIVNDLKIKMVGVTIKEHHTLESLYDDLKKLM